MSLLLIAEHDHKVLTSSTLSTLGAARVLSLPIEILVMGDQCGTVAEQASHLEGVKKVWLVEDPSLRYPLAERMTEILLPHAQSYSYILAPSTTFGKNLLPRLGALLDVCVLSDITAIENKKTFIRPIYAGNAFATVTSEDTPKLLTIRPTAFPKANPGDLKTPIEPLPFVPPSTPCPTFLKMKESQSERPDLSSASIIVSGGRGFQNKENFKLLEELADVLDAGIGASRAAVDAGFVPNDYQVGQTGKIVAPNLYIAIGISGAIQHLAGIKDSKVIAAINKDPEAPIFQMADYGLVGDLLKILPALISKIKTLKKEPME